jgi:hypothetical protein
MYHLMRRIKEHSIIISIFSLMLIASSFGIVSSIQFAAGQANQVNSDKHNNNANSLNAQNIPAKYYTLERYLLYQILC